MSICKVCHMTSAHPVEDVRIFHKECVSLAQAGFDVYLVERGESYDKNGVHVIGVGNIPQNRIKRMTKGTKKVYEVALSLDCDIYHFHDPELLPYGLKLKKQGKRVIFDSHELYRIQITNKNYLPVLIRKLIARVYSFYENRILPKLDAVIFPCLIDNKFPLPGKRKVLINNVPLMEEFYNYYDEDAAKNIDSICMVGTLASGRGITELIQASYLAGCEVYIGGEFHSLTYEDEIKSMNEAKKVHFLGKLDRKGVREILQKSIIGVAVLQNRGQYNIAENLPTKAYEYMAMGLPVILSKTPYNEKMLEKYKFGVAVEPTDVESYAEVIRNLLESPPKVKIMGANGRKVIAKEFNWDIEAKKLISLYKDIMNNL